MHRHRAFQIPLLPMEMLAMYPLHNGNIGVVYLWSGFFLGTFIAIDLHEFVARSSNGCRTRVFWRFLNSG